MTSLKLISVLIGIFLMLEAIDAARLMDKGDKICRMLKYSLVIGAAKMLMFNAPHWANVFFGVVIGSFFWPRLYQRFVDYRISRCPHKKLTCISESKRKFCSHPSCGK